MQKPYPLIEGRQYELEFEGKQFADVTLVRVDRESAVVTYEIYGDREGCSIDSFESRAMLLMDGPK